MVPAKQPVRWFALHLFSFHEYDIQIVKSKNIRTESQIESLIDEVVQRQGMLVHTLASPKMRSRVNELSVENNIVTVDLLGPILTGLF